MSGPSWRRNGFECVKTVDETSKEYLELSWLWRNKKGVRGVGKTVGLPMRQFMNLREPRA